MPDAGSQISSDPQTDLHALRGTHGVRRSWLNRNVIGMGLTSLLGAVLILRVW